MDIIGRSRRRKTRELLAAEREYTRFLLNLLALYPYASRRHYPRHLPAGWR